MRTRHRRVTPVGMKMHPSLTMARGAGAAPTPVNGDPIQVEVLGATMPSLAGGIVGNGRVARVRFMGMSTGQALVGNKFAFTVTRKTFSAGVAGTTSITVTGTAALRRPLPQTWANGLSIALGDRCVSAAKVSGSTRIYSCTAGAGTTATGSNPVHTTGSAHGADGITWLYVGSVQDTNVVPYRQAVEAAASSDVDVYVVLDKAIFASDVVTGCTIQSGAYGSSNASRAGVVSFTNSSTLTHDKPDCVALTMPWQIVGTTIDCRLVAIHPFFANSRTLDCVIFKVVDNTGAVVLTGSAVQSMQSSTLLTGGAPAAEFYQSLDISGLSDGLYGLAFEAYPFQGDNPYKSLTDGFGSGTPSSTMAPTANTSKVIPFRKDAAGTFGRVYAYVDSVSGNDATGQASPTAATAAASPFLTIEQAVRRATTGLQAVTNTNYSRNNCGNGVVRLVGPSGGAQRTFSGFGATMASAAKGDVWLTIERDPATSSSAADVAIIVDATTANKIGMPRLKWSEVTITGNSTAAALDNQVTTTVGEFAYETWFDKCAITGVSSAAQNPCSRMGLMWITNTALTHIGTTFGAPNNRSGLKLVAGCTLTGNLGSASTTSNFSIGALNFVGNIWSGGAAPSTHNATYWAEGTGTTQTNPDRGILYANKFSPCYRTIKWPLVGQTFTTGVSIAGNLFEVVDAGNVVKGGEHSGDGNVTAIGHLWYLFNTVAGEGANVLYNESGTTFAAKYGLQKFNCYDDRNSKADFYDSSPETASGLRVGNMMHRYGVDFEGNVGFALTDGTPSQKNLSGEVFEATLTNGTQASPLARNWTNDKSKSGTNNGGGDYRPTTSSAAYAKVGATRQAFPIDLGGTTRATNGNGASGAYEAA